MQLTGPNLDDYLSECIHTREVLRQQMMHDPDDGDFTLPAHEPRTLAYEEIADYFIAETREHARMDVGVEGDKYVISGSLADVVQAMCDQPAHYIYMLTLLVYRNPDKRTKKMWRKVTNALRDNMPFTLEQALRAAFREAPAIGYHRVTITHDNDVRIYKKIEGGLPDKPPADNQEYSGAELVVT